MANKVHAWQQIQATKRSFYIRDQFSGGGIQMECEGGRAEEEETENNNNDNSNMSERIKSKSPFHSKSCILSIWRYLNVC